MLPHHTHTITQTEAGIFEDEFFEQRKKEEEKKESTRGEERARLQKEEEERVRREEEMVGHNRENDREQEREREREKKRNMESAQQQQQQQQRSDADASTDAEQTRLKNQELEAQLVQLQQPHQLELKRIIESAKTPLQVVASQMFFFVCKFLICVAFLFAIFGKVYLCVFTSTSGRCCGARRLAPCRSCS